MAKRTKWTADQLREFREWHDKRMKELNYPDEIVKELTHARERWLPAQAPATISDTDSHAEFDTSGNFELNESPFFSRHSPSWISKTSPEE